MCLQCSVRKSLENRFSMDDARVDQLEEQLKQARTVAEEAEIKYDEVRCSTMSFRGFSLAWWWKNSQYCAYCRVHTNSFCGCLLL